MIDKYYFTYSLTIFIHFRMMNGLFENYKSEYPGKVPQL